MRKMIQNIMKQRLQARQVDLHKSLIRHEAKIGGELFGPVSPGGRREFFCLDDRTWVWHEEWVDNNGQKQIKTTRYDIRQDGIVKVQNGIYKTISFQEATRFKDAVNAYCQRVKNELYPFVS